MAKGYDRRQFLKSAGAISSLTLASAAIAQNGTPKNPPIDSPEDLNIAEKLIGMAYTDTEKAAMYDGLEEMVDRIRVRQNAAPMMNSDLPAMTFNPRVPGYTYKKQENRVTIAAIDAGPLPPDNDIAFAPIWKQGAWLRNGAITANRLTDIYLQRIQKIAPKLSCFVSVTNELARKEAYQADIELRSGKDRGPLHGIPYGLKDLADTANIRTTWGAEPYKSRVPEQDAEIVKRLRKAGAVLIGKTTLGALAYGDRWFGGITRNPWDITEGASGSSAGSASATAAGLCGFSIGSETLGSIISPSTRCGVTGLRPTFGRVPRTGAMALCWSLDKIGPICRSVEDTALVLAAINGEHGLDTSSTDWGFAYDGPAAAGEDIRIGYDPAWFEEATDSDKDILSRLKDMGFKLSQLTLPNLPYGSLLTTLEVEAAAAFEELTLSNRDDMLKWQEPKAWPNRFRRAHFISAVEALQVDRLRRKVMDIMANIYTNIDILISPQFAGDLMTITNFTGAPALTLPISMEDRESVPLTGTPNKLAKKQEKIPHPHGITLWGNLFREDQLLAVGRLLEDSIRFHTNRPVL